MCLQPHGLAAASSTASGPLELSFHAYKNVSVLPEKHFSQPQKATQPESVDDPDLSNAAFQNSKEAHRVR